ncbi:MAG: aldehyde ferredoxin oxidoreductase [Oscillospiraceae bacterium]|nr:aldehyde ferredoxin oxidoreductase [Oscillospiraceae bacterium]
MWSKLIVNMAEATVTKLPYDEEYLQLGGRALVANYFMDLVKTGKMDPKCDPMGEQNVLMFCTGVLAGTNFTTSYRISVGCKSPLTGGIKEASSGGYMGKLMADQGYRMITVHGLPQDGKLRYLHIDKEGNAELVDAEDLRLKGTYDVVDAMRERYGDGISVACIGPAGERLYKAASIQISEFGTLHPSRVAARGGVGALMGVKGLKAVVIEKPTIPYKVEYADEAMFREAAKELNAFIAGAAKVDPFHNFGTISTIEKTGANGILPVENFSGKLYKDYKKLGVEEFLGRLAARGGCNKKPCQPGCLVQCSNVYHDADGKYLTSGFEYETIALFGPNCRIDDLDKIAVMDRMCDDIGVDTIEMGTACGVAMDAGKLEWGDADGVIAMLEEMRQGVGFGPTLGDGCEAVGLALGAKRIPTVKHQAISGYDPRNTKGTGITYATCPQGADHTAALTMGRAFDDAGRTAQAYASNKLQVAICFSDSMMCLFAFSNVVPKMHLLANLMSGLYGGPVDITRVTIGLGVKTLLTERAFNKLAGFTDEDDKLPEFFLTERSAATGAVFDINPVEMEVLFDF